MAKIRLSVNKAHSTTLGGYSVLFDFKDHFPQRVVEVRNTAEALAALDAYAEEAKATGLSLVASAMLVRGERAPNGFKKANTQRFVNLTPEPA